MAQTHIVPGIGDRKVRDLKTVHIQAWIKSPKMHGLSLKSIRNMMTPLRGALFLAIEKELRDDNPAVGEALNLKACVKKEFHSTGWEPDPLNVHEIESLLKACDSEVTRNFFQLAFSTGLRTGEIIALKWSDIDFKTRTLTVQRAIVYAYEKKTKTKKGMRVVDLSAQAVQALRDQQQLTKDQPLIFYHPRTLLPLKNSSQVRNLWVAAVERAEIRYRSPYQTRHTYASQMITNDPKLNLFYLVDQMGHVGLDMINRHYGRWIRGNGKTAKRRR